MEFGPETSSIASSTKLSFHAYKQRPNWTLDAAWASFLVRAATKLRDGLEHDLGLHLGDSNWISFGPHLDLKIHTSLFDLYAILQAWSYARRSCPHMLQIRFLASHAYRQLLSRSYRSSGADTTHVYLYSLYMRRDFQNYNNLNTIYGMMTQLDQWLHE